ncbi:MAG: hypothetical protein MUC69_05565, partial [Gemmatimonadales bacterium]|nr:hypothetical protein [Gemmatimonadales bacterium]
MGAEMAVIVAVDRKLVRELESRRAFSTSTAVPVNTGTFVRRRRLERLVRAGVVHEARAGHYWLDQPAWAAFAARRRV